MSEEEFRGGAPDGRAGLDEGPVVSIPHIKVHAFCVMEETSAALQGAAADRRLARAHTEVYMGDIGGAANFYQGRATPDVVFLEFEDDRAKVKEDLTRLSDVCDERTKVILIGRVNDVVFYRDIMEMGISEYIVAPVSVAQIVRAVGRLYSEGEKALGRIIAFIGAKGGVGSSTIAHNCSWVISKLLGRNVVIADMDAAFGTLALNFNQEVGQGLSEALASPERLDQLLLDRLLVRHDESISLLGTMGKLSQETDFSEGAYDHLIDLLRKVAPYIVLDVPHMWSGWVKSLLRAADEVVVVVEPDLANVRNAKGICDAFKVWRPNDRPPRLVFNKVGTPKRPEIATKEFSEALGVPVTGVIGFDPYLFSSAANEGKMLVELHAELPIAGRFVQMTQAFTGRAGEKKVEKADKTDVVSRFLNKLNFGKS